MYTLNYDFLAQLNSKFHNLRPLPFHPGRLAQDVEQVVWEVRGDVSNFSVVGKFTTEKDKGHLWTI